MKPRHLFYLLSSAGLLLLVTAPKKRQESASALMELFWDRERQRYRTDEEVIQAIEADPSLLPSVITSTEGKVFSYLHIINSAGRYYNIQPAMIAAIIHQESRGDYAAKGLDGEIGLMQIMPGTARDMAFDGDIRELYNPSVNIFTGTKYLRFQLDRYGNLLDMIAAYNGGSVKKDKNGQYKNFAYVESVASRLYPRYVKLI